VLHGRTKFGWGFPPQDTPMANINHPKSLDWFGDQLKTALYSLCSDEFHCFPLDKTSTDGTCDWITDKGEFAEWLNHSELDKQRLCILGSRGCGKSYLARRIINKLIPLSEVEPIHCFLGTEVPGRGTLQALLRSTLHQIFRLMLKVKDDEALSNGADPTKRPTRPKAVDEGPLKTSVDLLLAQVTKAERFETGNGRYSADIWTQDRLITLWPSVVAEALADGKVTMVVDGLDALEVDDQKGFFNCLDELDRKLKDNVENAKRLKILILTTEDRSPVAAPPATNVAQFRQDQVLDAFGFRTYSVTPSDTESDIRRTVLEGLNAIWTAREYTDNQLKRRMCDKIVRNSGGNYLWAALVVDELGRRPVITDELMDRVPRTVNGLYHYILDRITGSSSGCDTEFTKQVLKWAIFQQGPLKAAEFNTAQAIAMAQGKKPSKKKVENKDLEEFLSGNINTKINFHCGPLVKITDGGLELVHSSLKEYLTTGISISQFPSLLGGLSNESHSHGEIAATCMTYLTMPQFKEPSTERDGGAGWRDKWEAKVRKTLREYRFLRYAARYWYKHLYAARPNSSDDLDPRRHGNHQQRRLLLPSPDEPSGSAGRDSKPFAANWTDAWWFLTKGRLREYPHSCPANEIVSGLSKDSVAPANNAAEAWDKDPSDWPGFAPFVLPEMVDTQDSQVPGPSQVVYRNRVIFTRLPGKVEERVVRVPVPPPPPPTFQRMEPWRRRVLNASKKLGMYIYLAVNVLCLK